VDNIDWGHLFFQFDGRINRAKFWLGIVAIWIVEAILFAILTPIGFDSAIAAVLGLAVAVVAIWVGLAIAIKRWHDRGKSGWWVLIVLIPIIGSIWALIETGFLPGTDGPNEYGPDPLAAA
jgi:uncharacterized membrane protein YhaH (DUF805 family)